ncbi:S-adenosyl-L-methionine-dependent methyltransferase [Obelidium mucronatum]|nr:S-adenosyl-L-methionine-dependent methyltransferase [Obelidium mucronatum]
MQAALTLPELTAAFPNDEAPSDTNFPRWIEDDSTFAPFIPTSMARVNRALSLAGCAAGDVVLDLGCGDGRFCVAAVALFGCKKAIGIESDEGVVDLANSTRDKLLPGLQADTITYACQDFRDCLLARDATVSIVVVFLSPEFGKECKELLKEHYERGARIISLVFDLSDIPEFSLKDGCKDIDGIWVYEKVV